MYCTSQQDKFVVECDEPIPTKRARVDDNDKVRKSLPFLMF